MSPSKSSSSSLKATPTKDDGPITKSFWVEGFGEGVRKGPPRLVERGQRCRGFIQKRSTRWLDCAPLAQSWLPIPLINRNGKLSGHTLCRWNCEPAQWIASVVSTVTSRLRRYALKHNKGYIVSRYQRLFTRVSGYYVLTRNDYLMDRILYLLRNLEEKGKYIHRVLLNYLTRLDDNKRFVYSQVSYQTNWLLFRACRRPRDKSKFKFKGSDFPTINTAVVDRRAYLEKIFGTSKAINDAIFGP